MTTARTILAIIPLLVCLCAFADEAPQELLVEELKMSVERLRQENDSLKRELVQKDEEISRIRSLYADTILGINESANHLKQMELTAANLLGEQKADDDRRLEEELAVIAMLRDEILAGERELSEFERRLDTLFEVLKPSDTMRDMLNEKLADVRNVLNRAMAVLVPADSRTGGTARQQGAEVVRMDSNAQAIFLDKGFRHELRNGQILSLMRDGKPVVRVRIVDCRPDSSAAIVFEGDWNSLYTGCRLFPEIIAQ